MDAKRRVSHLCASGNSATLVQHTMWKGSGRRLTLCFVPAGNAYVRLSGVLTQCTLHQFCRTSPAAEVVKLCSPIAQHAHCSTLLRNELKVQVVVAAMRWLMVVSEIG